MVSILGVQILCFILFLGLSAFFSSSETAITSINKLHVHKLRQGEQGHSPLDLWLKDPNRILATLLVGNNISNVAASILAAFIANHFFPQSSGIAGAIAFAGTTCSILIFGEIIPKIFAKHHFETLAPRFIRTLDLLYYPFFPIIWISLALSNLVVWLLGNKNGKGPFMTEDDIKFLIEVSERDGVLEEEEREMIHSIIEFGDTIAKEVMVPRTDMVRLRSNATLKESLQILVSAGHSRIPVYEERIDNIVGILYAKDLLFYWQRMHQQQKLPEGQQGSLDTIDQQFNMRDLLRSPTFVPETKKVSELLKEFRRDRTHMAIVVDEYGGTAGLITIEDVLEEIVGEIRDEHDREGERYRQIGTNQWEIDARMTLADLENEIHVKLPEGEDFETLSGLISSITGRVPEVGETIEHEGYRMTILEGNERHVQRIRLEQQSKPDLAPKSLES